MVERSIDPLVSTEWLESQRGAGLLVIIDIRETPLYEAGHIPGAISIPFSPVSDWATSDDELLLELPGEAELFKVIGDWGITADSWVVVVGAVHEPPAPPYPLADAARVATTLIYAGVENVAILNGGYPRWAAEGREATSEVPKVSSLTYRNEVRDEMFVSTEYVKGHLGESLVIDGRDPDEYFGAKVDTFAGSLGHVPTAMSLPAIWIWEADGAYKPVEVLRQMAAGVLGESRQKEIITYCGVGGYASAWWFVLTQLLDYQNVRIYDGAAQAWAKQNAMVPYTWAS